MRIYTRRGDDGTTGLLYGGRMDKSEVRAAACGTTDEAVAALGVARAFLTQHPCAELVLRLQRELFVLGAELATDPRNTHKLSDGHTRVTSDMVVALETVIDELVAGTVMPKEFVVPGADPASAAVDLARAVVRRGEREVVGLFRSGQLERPEPLHYLNRLADLLFVLARHVEGAFTPVRGSSGAARGAAVPQSGLPPEA